MALPFSIAAQTSNIPGTYFDQNNVALGAMGVLTCTASGTNTIALTQAANQPAISAYANNLLFSFVAANTSTGSITVNVNAIGALNLYLADAVTQASTGNIVSGAMYVIGYNSSFNSNAGGFQILSSTSAGSAIKTVHEQAFTSTGTYTPTTGMLYCAIEVWGGGGGGGGVSAASGASGGGGGAGGYSKKIFSSATIGASQSVTIGAAGAAGSNSGGAGGTGGTTSVGSGPLLQATGGLGGSGSTSASLAVAGGGGGTGSSGTINATGAPGIGNVSPNIAVDSQSGAGGSTSLGGGGLGLAGNSNSAGNAGAVNSGSGGSGATSGGTGELGGAGAKGFVYITEWCSQ